MKKKNTFPGGTQQVIQCRLDTILVKSLGTLCTFANIWSFCLPPPPHPQHNVDVDSSKVDPLGTWPSDLITYTAAVVPSANHPHTSFILWVQIRARI